MEEGFMWVAPDTASGHLGMCAYVFFEKKERQQEGWKAEGSRQMAMEKGKAVCSGGISKFQVMNFTFSALKWEKGVQ